MHRGILRFASVSAPKVLGGIATAALNVYLLRRLPAEEFAVLSICLAGIVIVDGLAGSALDLATVKLGSVPEFSAVTRAEIQKHAIFAKLAAALVALVVVLVARDAIWSAITHRTQGSALLFSCCAACGGLLIVRSAQVQMQLQRNFGAYGLFDSLHIVLRLAALIACVWIGFVSSASLLLCYAVAPILVTAVWFFVYGREVFLNFRVRGDVLRLLMANVNWLLITFGLSAVISRMDLFLVSRWGSLREAGLFAGGQSLAIFPQMIGLYLSVVFGPSIMPKLADGSFFAYFRLVQKWLLLFALVALAAFAALWPSLAHVLLPARYLQSSATIQALIPGALAGMVTFPLTLSFVMFIRPRFLFTVDCIAFPVLLPLYFFAIHRFGAPGAAWVTTGAALTRASIAQTMAWKWASASAGSPGLAKLAPSLV